MERLTSMVAAMAGGDHVPVALARRRRALSQRAKQRQRRWHAASGSGNRVTSWRVRRRIRGARWELQTGLTHKVLWDTVTPAPDSSPSNADIEVQRSRDVLGVIEDQQRKVAGEVFPEPTAIFAMWGSAYLVGFGAIWLSWGHGGTFSAWGAAALLGLLGVVATVVSVVRLTRFGQGVNGPSRRTAITFTWCWPVAMAGVAAFDLGLEQHGPASGTVALLWPASFLLVAAVLFLAAGTLWDDTGQLALGIWSLAVAAASTFAGSPANFAVLAFAGGGGPRDRPGRPVGPSAVVSDPAPAPVVSPEPAAMPALDPVIHAQPRLRVVVTLASLAGGDRLTFPRLQELVEMTAGNLSTHLRRLEDAGYVSLTKTYRRRTPVTYVALTRSGRRAFEDYTAALGRLLDRSDNDDRKEPT